MGSGINDDRYNLPADLRRRNGYRVRAGTARGVRQCYGHDRQARIPQSRSAPGAVLETGVYLVPLMEALALPERTAGFANPKSSTGRIDVFTRLITDFAAFDTVPAGYKGTFIGQPAHFSDLVRAGSRLAVRFRRAHPAIPMPKMGDSRRNRSGEQGGEYQPGLAY